MLMLGGKPKAEMAFRSSGAASALTSAVAVAVAGLLT